MTGWKHYSQNFTFSLMWAICRNGSDITCWITALSGWESCERICSRSSAIFTNQRYLVRDKKKREWKNVSVGITLPPWKRSNGDPPRFRNVNWKVTGKDWQSLCFKKSSKTKSDTYEILNLKYWIWLIKDIIRTINKCSLFTAS